MLRKLKRNSLKSEVTGINPILNNIELACSNAAYLACSDEDEDHSLIVVISKKKYQIDSGLVAATDCAHKVNSLSFTNTCADLNREKKHSLVEAVIINNTSISRE